MEKKELLIFDLDGTLLDTIEDLARATNYALEAFQLPTHSVESYRFMVGNGIHKLLERALPPALQNNDGVSMIKNDFLTYYFKHGDTFTRPYEGIVELLSHLHASGYQLGVASNKMHEATVELVHRFFSDIPFIQVLGLREGKPAKPSPDILHEIVATAKVSAKATLYMGDSGVDASTAINAGIDFMGVLWGFRPKAELEAAGARVFVSHPREICRWLQQHS